MNIEIPEETPVCPCCKNPECSSYDWHTVREFERVNKLLGEWTAAATHMWGFGRVQQEPTPERLREAIARAMETERISTAYFKRITDLKAALRRAIDAYEGTVRHNTEDNTDAEEDYLLIEELRKIEMAPDVRGK